MQELATHLISFLCFTEHFLHAWQKSCTTEMQFSNHFTVDPPKTTLFSRISRMNSGGYSPELYQEDPGDASCAEKSSQEVIKRRPPVQELTQRPIDRRGVTSPLPIRLNRCQADLLRGDGQATFPLPASITAGACLKLNTFEERRVSLGSEFLIREFKEFLTPPGRLSALVEPFNWALSDGIAEQAGGCRLCDGSEQISAEEISAKRGG